MLKAEKKLSQKQKDKLNRVKEASPLVGMMHSLKEEFHCSFEESKKLGEGTLRLIAWLLKAETYYQKSARTIKRQLAEIVGYFETRTTQGIVKGINNKALDFDNFQSRALLFWHFPENLAK